MAYFADLSEYAYLPRWSRPGTKSVGWLDADNAFPTAPPNEIVLKTLWAYCRISVAQTRGGHLCPLCDDEHGIEYERDGECLLLGTAEIRVFGDGGKVYAAPTLIYHYVEAHHYEPPGEFVQAMLNGPQPDSEEYFELLRRAALEWNKTSEGGQGYVNLCDIRPEDVDVPLIELMRRNAKRKALP